MVQVIRDKLLNHLVRPPKCRTMLRCIHNEQGLEWIPCVLVGNKSDLRPDQRQVSIEQGKALAEKFDCAYTETSARYNENVGKAFELVISQIEKQQNPNEPSGGNKCMVM